ncbi:RND transporter, partial [Kouleothrix aurantiaca]
MTTLPQSRLRGRFKRPSLPVILAAVLVIAAIIAIIVRFAGARTADPLAGGSVVAVARGPLVAGISATGKVEPRRQAELACANPNGRVTDVLVNEGDAVAQGAPLVQLDVRQLQAAVVAAEAALSQAKADLQALQEGATPEEIAAARAQVAAAQGALRQT